MSMKRIVCILAFLGLFLSMQVQAAQRPYEANWASLDARPTPQWFSDAKFGVFICWGLYSVPAWTPPGKSIIPRPERNLST